MDKKISQYTNILFLTNNKRSLKLYQWLKDRDESVILSEEKLNLDFIKKINPHIIISFNYKYIIKRDIIEYMKGNIINLHISLLPWNRGANPNFWSFIDNTPKGVTIHYINEGLDTGEILFQKEFCFNEKEETFETTYNQLNNAVMELFQIHWDEIKTGIVKSVNQVGEGSSHSLKDMEKVLSACSFTWKDNIADFKIKYNEEFRF